MYTRAFVCIALHTHARTHTYTHSLTHTCMYAPMRAHVPIAQSRRGQRVDAFGVYEDGEHLAEIRIFSWQQGDSLACHHPHKFVELWLTKEEVYNLELAHDLSAKGVNGKYWQRRNEIEHSSTHLKGSILVLVEFRHQFLHHTWRRSETHLFQSCTCVCAWHA